MCAANSRRFVLFALAAVLGPAIASGQVVSTAPVTGVAGAAGPTKTPTPVSAAKTVVLPAAPPSGNAGGSPQPGGSALPHNLPPFVLSEVFYFEPFAGTRYQATQQSGWALPVVDTLKTWTVSFLFDSNVPKQEIAEIVEKKVCCSQLLLAGQSVPVVALAFSGEKVFVRATVQDMRAWPKTVQLWMFHHGNTASPPDAGKASSMPSGAPPPGVGQSQAPSASRLGASSAPVPRPFMDYKSPPVAVKATKLSYFAKYLYPTFSHARCTDCHSMGDPAAVRSQHDASGVPNVVAVNAHVTNCGGTSCHSQVKDWRTPPFARGINWKGKGAREVCRIVTTHLPSAEQLHIHFHDDPRVLWAVSSGWIPANLQGKGQGIIPTAPPHSTQVWFQLVDTWINGGFPCPE